MNPIQQKIPIFDYTPERVPGNQPIYIKSSEFFKPPVFTYTVDPLNPTPIKLKH